MVRRPTPFLTGLPKPRKLKVAGFGQKIEPPRNKNTFEAERNRQAALEALAGKMCLALTYLDCHRVVEVHTVGITTAGRPAMSVWQVDGESNTPPIPDWRLMCFDECFDVRLSDVPSTAPRPDYKKGAKQFRRIDAEL